MAGFFTQVQRTERVANYMAINDNLAIDLRRLPEHDQLRPPKLLGGAVLQPAAGVPLRRALAEWLTAPENPYFARAMVNRMWGHFFGRGLVNPVDDMHEGNPPSHPELLAELTRQFIASGFDLKYLSRAICSTDAYQRTSRPLEGNARDQELFSRMAIKVLTPEQLFDSLTALTGGTGRPGGGPGRAPFNSRNDPRHEFVAFFRSEGDPDPTSYDRGIPQLLRMMNSPQFLGPRTEDVILRQLAQPGVSPEQVIEGLYLRVLARRPEAEERRILDDFIHRHRDPQQAYAEVLWALLNSSEFILNH
jgi:hypothetical protein